VTDPYDTFCGNWADEVEREEALLEPTNSAPRSTVISRRPPRARDDPRSRAGTSCAARNTRSNNKKKKKKGKKRMEYKLFFGGIIFADLEEGLFEMEDSIGEDVEPEVLFAAYDTLKKLRIDCLESMFNEFGEVTRTKPNWEKRYCHVAYRNLDDASRAFQVLARAEERKKRQEEFGDTLEAAGLPRFAAPLPNFYVRWPRGSPAAPTARCASRQLCPDPKNEQGRILYWLTSTAAEARWDLLNDTTTTMARDEKAGETATIPRTPEVITVALAARKEEGSVQSHVSVPLSASSSASMMVFPLSLAA